jgi:hypothetical protein
MTFTRRVNQLDDYPVPDVGIDGIRTTGTARRRGTKAALESAGKIGLGALDPELPVLRMPAHAPGECAGPRALDAGTSRAEGFVIIDQPARG